MVWEGARDLGRVLVFRVLGMVRFWDFRDWGLMDLGFRVSGLFRGQNLNPKP